MYQGLSALTRKELAELIRREAGEGGSAALFEAARQARQAHYGNRVFLRGLIECSSYCAQDCYYCGLRRSNLRAERYRLDRSRILASCDIGHRLGFRTFVLQGGEDRAFSDAIVCGIIDAVKTGYPDCAVTLSLGERSRESYLALYRAGADRYLLRHETADAAHYEKLHPPGQTLQSRRRCLYDLREIGYQTGAGMMIGSPGQTAEHLAEDLIFLRELVPHMVGIGPFLPHRDTPFREEPAGSLEVTLLMLALTRLLLPDVLLPATTALGSMHPRGRGMGFAAGCNVVMPNLSPPDVRESYSLYDGKLSSGAEAAEGLRELCGQIRECGLEADFSRGDHHSMANEV